MARYPAKGLSATHIRNPQTFQTRSHEPHLCRCKVVELPNNLSFKKLANDVTGSALSHVPEPGVAIASSLDSAVGSLPIKSVHMSSKARSASE